MTTLTPQYLGEEIQLSLEDFARVVYQGSGVALSEPTVVRLQETRNLIDVLLEQKVKVYGLTTGFANLRNRTIPPEKASELSENLIRSHDAGIGPCMPKEVVRGAMLLRINSLAKGHSGFSLEALQTLVQMLNADIIPDIPATGSLGASGDLATLARLGRAMMGDPVMVTNGDTRCLAAEALKKHGITPFRPRAKEGLALTNGTSFMASMLAHAYMQEIHHVETMLALQALFLNSVQALDAAFSESIHHVRNQKGQSQVAKILAKFLHNSPFVDSKKVQDDYCIRCLPQIFGPKIELILSQRDVICNELDAVTDNPLLFKNEEILDSIAARYQMQVGGDRWAILSGGNFHGENLATSADVLCMANAKLALTLERQITYVLNPDRNGHVLPTYLICNEQQQGLLSGFMIPQYTANALAQKICQLANPVSAFNITSANESEDVVSYGASAGQKLLEQLELFRQLLAVYGTVMMQAYSIARLKFPSLSAGLPCEQLFSYPKKKIRKLNSPLKQILLSNIILTSIKRLVD